MARAGQQTGHADGCHRGQLRQRGPQLYGTILDELPLQGHAELEAIGRCLHAVVMLTHEEPASPDVMPSFLGRATWTIAAADVHAVCEPLGLREQSDVIRLSDGSEVQVTRTEDIDEFDDGETVFNILYRFETPTCPEPAETSLQLHMGG